MRIDRIYIPVETLGPGKRIALWTQGCSKHCPGCSNPELWSPTGGRNLPDAKLAALLCSMNAQAGIDRITITGGDPLEQPNALLSVLREIKPHFCDILVYTGYTIDQAKQALGTTRFAEFASLVDVVIDGPYIQDLNDGICALRGSTNQQVHVLSTDPALQRAYSNALREPRRVQNVVFGDRSLSIGIHAT